MTRIFQKKSETFIHRLDDSERLEALALAKEVMARAYVDTRERIFFSQLRPHLPFETSQKQLLVRSRLGTFCPYQKVGNHQAAPTWGISDCVQYLQDSGHPARANALAKSLQVSPVEKLATPLPTPARKQPKKKGGGGANG